MKHRLTFPDPLDARVIGWRVTSAVTQSETGTVTALLWDADAARPRLLIKWDGGIESVTGTAGLRVVKEDA